MKKLLSVFLISLTLVSCLITTNEETLKEEPAKEDKTEDALQNDQSSFYPIEGREAVIQTALMAAPKESREGCKIIGYNQEGELITYREGENQFIVLTDDPNKAGFSAACYHVSLEPFMARGRELKAEGKGREEIFEIREAEVKSGKLQMGNPGSTLHIYYGPDTDYDPESGEVKNAKYRYVTYIPFATPETTGLPIQPIASNHPWIMDPGTHRAHIMISPVSDNLAK